jgi:hypothetical protein
MKNEHAVALGRKGGLATKKKHGKNYYKKIRSIKRKSTPLTK